MPYEHVVIQMSLIITKNEKILQLLKKILQSFLANSKQECMFLFPRVALDFFLIPVRLSNCV